MQKINRLGWADGISFVSYGWRIGIRVNDPGVMNRLPEILPPGWKPAPSPVVEFLYSLRVSSNPASARIRNYNLLYAGAGRLARSLDRDEVFETLESSLQTFAAFWAKRRVFVRAGVVGWRGRAIVLPGEPSSGRTTLVAALVRAGATYYSDEYAVFDAKGRVHPFPTPLAMRDERSALRGECSPEVFGGRAGVKPLPVGLIAMTEFQPGARWRPRPLSAGRAVLGLLSHTIPVRHRPADALATFEPVVSQASILKGKRGEADQTAPMLLAALQ